MGFPVGYTDIFIPPLFLHTLTFFTHFHNLLSTIFSSLGLPEFLDPYPSPNPYPPRPPVSAILTRELLPLIKVSDVEERENYNHCSVCLYEVRRDDVIRWLGNCKHIFHRDCVDRWMDLDHHTCPLCRTPFLLDDLLLEFDQRLLLSDLHRQQQHHHDDCSDLA